MSQQRAIRAALTAACLFVLPALASAQGVPLAPPGVAGKVLFSNPPLGLDISTFGTFPLSQPTGSLQFTAAGTPSPFLSADATMAPFFFGSASGTLVYQMQVVGPDGDVPVSVSVAGGVSGSSELLSGDDFASFAMKATWQFESIGGSTPLFFEDGITTPALTGAFSQSFGGTHEFMLTANQAYKVTMVVIAGARGGSASAFVDPIFSFGTGGDEYTFLFSEGIGNTPLVPVPEPETWLLLSVGLLTMRAMLRAKNRRSFPTSRR